MNKVKKDTALSLSKEEILELSKLREKPYKDLTEKEREALLSLGAKDFGSKFSGVIKTLANE